METTNYMVLGFAVIFGVLFLHLLSIFFRNRNLRYELEALEQISKRSSGKKISRRKRTSRR